MRLKPLTRKQRENLRAHKWVVFERTHREVDNWIVAKYKECTSVAQRKRLQAFRNRMHFVFATEFGEPYPELSVRLTGNNDRKIVSIEVV